MWHTFSRCFITWFVASINRTHLYIQSNPIESNQIKSNQIESNWFEFISTTKNLIMLNFGKCPSFTITNKHRLVHFIIHWIKIIIGTTIEWSRPIDEIMSNEFGYG